MSKETIEGSPQNLEISDDGYLVIECTDINVDSFKVAVKYSNQYIGKMMKNIMTADLVEFTGEWKQNLGYFFVEDYRVVESGDEFDETRNLERIRGIPLSVEVYDNEMAFNVKFGESWYPADEDKTFETTFEYTENDDLGSLLEDVMTSDELRLIGYWQNNIFHVRGYEEYTEKDELRELGNEKFETKEQDLDLTNHQMIEFAYTVKETIQDYLGIDVVSDKVENLTNSFYTIKEIVLPNIPNEYLSEHEEIQDFFFGHELEENHNAELTRFESDRLSDLELEELDDVIDEWST